MKRTVLLLPLLCLLAACQQPAAPQTPLAESTDAAARIGPLYITQQDVQDALDLLDEKDRLFAQTSIGKQNFIQILTRRKLILQDAHANGLDQQPEFLALQTQKRAELEKVFEVFSQDALERLWYEQHTSKWTPSEKEIKDYFEKYPYEMTLKQIIVDNAQTADQALRALKAAPGRWKEIARQYNNIAPTNLQTLTFMPGEYLESLEVVASNSPIGKVQGFFKTPQGFHIIMKTNEKQLPFKEAQPRIKQILQNQKLDELLDTLKTKYEVIIYDQNQ